MSSTSSRTPTQASSSNSSNQKLLSPLGSSLTQKVPSDNSGGGNPAVSGGVVGAAPGIGGGAATKKKFGKNLNKLTKPPAAASSSSGAPGSFSGGSFNGRGGAGGAFRGSASSRNGLLLLSTKSKSGSDGGSGSSGRFLTPTAKSFSTSVHDALLSAVEGRANDGASGKNAALTTPAAWGSASEKQQVDASNTTTAANASLPTAQEVSETEKSGSEFELNQLISQQHKQLPLAKETTQEGDSGHENTSILLAPRGRLSAAASMKSASFSATSALSGVCDEKEDSFDSKSEVRKSEAAKQTSLGENSSNLNDTNIIRPVPSSDYSDSSGAVDKAFRHESYSKKQSDEQVQYMSKLAKEKAEKLRSEEGARMMQQKERAAKRLKELEEKRSAVKAAEKDKIDVDTESYKKPTSLGMKALYPRPLATAKASRDSTIAADPSVRGQISKPSSQIVLEPLGKPKKILTKSNNAKSNDSSDGNSEAAGNKKLFDPNRTFSSLVGGKSKSNDAAIKHELETKSNIRLESHRHANSHPHPNSNHLAHDDKQLAAEPEKEESPPVQMIHLNSYDDRDRGGRGTVSGPRMLFDPKSGSMVAVPSREDSTPKGSKKIKQKSRKEYDYGVNIQRSPLSKHNSDGGPSRDVTRVLSSRQSDGSVNDSNELKNTRKQRARKEEQNLQRKDKKPIDKGSDAHDSGGRHGSTKHQKQHPRSRIPRTCGVLYSKDENGNYVNTDGCDPDNGYGAHTVPGGRIRNPNAFDKFMKQQQQLSHDLRHHDEQLIDKITQSYSGELNFNAQVRNDPSFLKHQSDFEEQQVRLLEEAWSSLLEEEPKNRHEPEVEEYEDCQVKGSTWNSSVDRFGCAKAKENRVDEYAAALAISPSMIGLGFDPTENMDAVINGNKNHPIDMAKFALEAASVGASKSSNLFSHIGGGSRLFDPSTWGTGHPDNSSSLGDLGALSGWDFASSTNEEGNDPNSLNGSNVQSSSQPFLSFPTFTGHDHAWGALSGFRPFGDDSSDKHGAE